jgi:hypothetical protein
MTRTPQQHRDDSRHAAHTMWAGVGDRGERLSNMHLNSPSGYRWHARRLFGQDVDVNALTDEQWEQVEAARISWYKATAMKAVRARRRKYASKLRERAAAIEAEADDDGGGAA